MRDYLVALYGADRRPELVMEDAAAACAAEPHVPFPELEGGYVRLESQQKSKADTKPDRNSSANFIGVSSVPNFWSGFRGNILEVPKSTWMHFVTFSDEVAAACVI